MKHLSLAAPVSVMVTAALIWAAAGWLCYANWRRASNRRIAGRLEALRFILDTEGVDSVIIGPRRKEHYESLGFEFR